jgi:phospholipase/carboxylesterase
MADLVTIGEWTLRVRQPDGAGPHRLILMLHGWTGDEDVMWVFASRLPKDAWLVAPRGLYATPNSGYAWHSDFSKACVNVDDFRPAMDALWQLLTPQNFPDVDLNTIGLVGFSQGAALAYSMALTLPQRVRCLAGLAGFMPGNAERWIANQPLRGKTVFLAHGEHDDIVGLDRAVHAVQVLESAGAQVTHCFDDVGHKLGASCFRSLENYFNRCWPVQPTE